MTITKVRSGGFADETIGTHLTVMVRPPQTSAGMTVPSEPMAHAVSVAAKMPLASPE